VVEFTLNTQDQGFTDFGGEMASTWITRLEVHAVMTANHVNQSCNTIVANDDNFEGYALAA
jgi:hypothetical protein